MKNTEYCQWEYGYRVSATKRSTCTRIELAWHEIGATFSNPELWLIVDTLNGAQFIARYTSASVGASWIHCRVDAISKDQLDEK